ncbi:DUF7269 family protein [Natronoarchaeum rubrum]|uniref:DUF7269 family protein n=1 Tax=Natronoarchaeum rubrum TaxID=755311 RepID=UPI0021114F53|nr:hypothetical protein [Natronoarchaeum rubrum]
MTATSRVLTGVGVLLAVAGLTVFLVPSLGGAAAAGRFYVGAVGALAVLQGGRYARDAWRSPLVGADTGDPELVSGVPTPGDDFDEALAATFEVHSLEGRKEVEARLDPVARAVLERRRDLSAAEAERRLDAGDWTDDPVAAAFFSDAAGDRIPFLTRLRIRWGGKSSYGVRAERAAAELERIWRAES